MILIIIVIILIIFYFFRKTKLDINFIKKIDKERYIILKNHITTFKKLIKNVKHYDYLHDIYTNILELLYSLHIEPLKPKYKLKVDNLITIIQKEYYNDIMLLKKQNKLLNDYTVVPANYRPLNNMLP
tara:strand:- start:172 stop:555 length:384 start_codon:yes stop_codon:yes gene_type:complete